MLFTLLGLCALYLRDRDKVNTHPGRDENVRQSDDGEPSYQDITSDPEVRCTAEEPITGDPEVSDDQGQYQSLEDPITDDPHIDGDSSDDVFYSVPEDAGDPHVDEDCDDVFYSVPEDTVTPQLETIMDINSCRYEIGIHLGAGGYGTVRAATRLTDGLQVAVKIVSKEPTKYVSVDGYTSPVPLEVALHIRANEPRIPQIIQLLDWQDETDRYIMVLERPMPCLSLDDFLRSYTGTMDMEDLARIIMCQTNFAAQTCCQRGVFHRDIKPENLLINLNTLEVKLIDFGCGEMLDSTGYTSFTGTAIYCPPERGTDGRYHGKPTTVWTLGLLCFVMVCGHYPKRQDLKQIFRDNTWRRDGLSQECCDFIFSCLRLDPKKRLELDKLNLHSWFTIYDNSNTTFIDINSYRYKIGIKLGKGGYGTVHDATRLKDGLQVAVKFVSKELAKYVSDDHYPVPVPLEVALHIRVNEPRVPQIIQLLDWQDETDCYIMVLERPIPCLCLVDFLEGYTGTMDEDLARIIMRQITFAAQTCCQRGVFHRDIKLENMLINPNTLEVKLIDFGCGELLSSAGYTSFIGTIEYCPPEYRKSERYFAEPATVWSLGIVLFLTVSKGDFPKRQDLDKISKSTWSRDGLSQECCDLICSCLRLDPKERIELEKVSLHPWFKMK